MQVAGFGAGIERTICRAAMKEDVDLPNNKQFIKRAHYYSGDDDLEHFFGGKINHNKMDKFPELFRVFIVICIQMRKQQQEMGKSEYIREFLKQAAIQAMYSFDLIGRKKIDTISTIMVYLVTSYIITHGKYINW